MTFLSRAKPSAELDASLNEALLALEDVRRAFNLFFTEGVANICKRVNKEILPEFYAGVEHAVTAAHEKMARDMHVIYNDLEKGICDAIRGNDGGTVSGFFTGGDGVVGE